VIEYRLLQIQEREFQKKFGIKNVLDEAFSAYISRRKKITRSEDIQSIPGTKSCPRIVGWALSRAQLNAMGVIGIEEFHFPYRDQKKPELEARMPLVRSGIYFGAEKDLATYCSGQPINWFEHQWNKLKKVF